MKRALCIGINDYPGDGNDLNGCVNDANNWAALLTDNFDFPKSGVTLLTDTAATKQNFMRSIESLLAGARSDDVLVLTISAHGSYTADRSGDEPTYDEVICPYDAAENDVTDDELRALFTEIPSGVRLTVIADTCFSGTVTRASPMREPPDKRRVRFLNPAVRGEQQLSSEQLRRARNRRSQLYPESGMKEVLLAAANDRQYATDALIDGSYAGAMSHFAIQIIRDASYRITYAELHGRLLDLIAADYSQDPQLEGTETNKSKQVFS